MNFLIDFLRVFPFSPYLTNIAARISKTKIRIKMKKKIITLSTLMLCLMVAAFAQNKKATGAVKDVSADRMVLISTSFGDMKIKLYNATPKHRDNFIKLAEQGYYDSLLFHRVIRNFMIQGGDPLSKNAAPGTMLGMGDIGYTIPAEFVDTIFHKKGALCAARTENPEKASSGCQFYIVQGQVMSNEQLTAMEQQRGRAYSAKERAVLTTLGGTPFLDQNYTVFGEVVEGLDVIDKIAAVKTAPGDRPVEDIRMKVSVIK
jgi:cyclophilin family peptidyl-prolyl cis-trans isomerase